MHELFSPHNREKCVANPLLNFSLQAQVSQKTNVNASAWYSITHYLANSPCNSSRLTNHGCEWTQIVWKCGRVTQDWATELSTIYYSPFHPYMCAFETTVNVLYYSLFSVRTAWARCGYIGWIPARHDGTVHVETRPSCRTHTVQGWGRDLVNGELLKLKLKLPVF